jgi:hypothetical protein
MSWFTQSKVFCKSIKMPPTLFFLNSLSLLLIKLNEANSVEDVGRQPNCSGANILIVYKRFMSLLYIIFSKIFENEGNKEIGL